MCPKHLTIAPHRGIRDQTPDLCVHHFGHSTNNLCTSIYSVPGTVESIGATARNQTELMSSFKEHEDFWAGGLWTCHTLFRCCATRENMIASAQRGLWGNNGSEERWQLSQILQKDHLGKCEELDYALGYARHILYTITYSPQSFSMGCLLLFPFYWCGNWRLERSSQLMRTCPGMGTRVGSKSASIALSSLALWLHNYCGLITSASRAFLFSVGFCLVPLPRFCTTKEGLGASLYWKYISFYCSVMCWWKQKYPCDRKPSTLSLHLFLSSLHSPHFFIWPSNGTVPRASNIVIIFLLILSLDKSHHLYKDVLITEHNRSSVVSQHRALWNFPWRRKQ